MEPIQFASATRAASGAVCAAARNASGTGAIAVRDLPLTRPVGLLGSAGADGLAPRRPPLTSIELAVVPTWPGAFEA